MNNKEFGETNEMNYENEKNVNEGTIGNSGKNKGNKTIIIIIAVCITLVLLGLAVVIGVPTLMFSWINNKKENLMEDFDQQTNMMMDEFNQRTANMMEEQDEIIKSNEEKFNKSSFNNELLGLQGKHSTFIISGYLDRIINNNKTNSDHIITVTYKDISSDTEEGIEKIKNSLESNTYHEVSFNYDADGYINLVTIKDI